MSQAEQYPYGLNQAIHALAVDAWSRDFDYAEYLRYAAKRDLLMGNVLAPMTEVAYKAVCTEWEAKMEKDMLEYWKLQFSTDPNDNKLLEHWNTAIVPVADHLFNQRNHTE